jgi:hypothetical protein
MAAVFREKTLESPHLATRNKSSSSQRPSNLIYHILQADLSWAILLVLLNLVFFSDVLFTDKTFFVRDVSFFHYPLKKLVTEAYSQGHLPLWNPYVQLGQPLLANPNAMAFYPTQLLFQLLPFELAFDLHFVLHCLLAGVASFYLARALTISRHASFLSAVVYNFSGVTLSFLNLFNILPVVAFLPLLALSLLSAVRQFSLVKTACTSFLFGIFFLLLEPLSSLAVCLFLLPFLGWIFAFLPQPRMSFTKGALLVVVMVASGVSLAAVQILPTLELIHYSGRSKGMDFGVISFWSLHPVSLLQVIFPRFFGEYFRLAEPPPWGNMFFDNREPYLLSCYLGLIPLLLALFGGLFARRRLLGGLLLGISFVALLLAMGKYFAAYSWLFQNIPVFRYGRYPVKFLVVASFCFSLLVGLGLDRLEELRTQLARGPKRTRLGIFLFASLILVLLCLSAALSFERVLNWFTAGAIGHDHISFHYHGQPINIRRPIISDALQKIQIHLGGFLLLLGLAFWSKVRLSILRVALLSLVFLDLSISNFWINPLVRSELYEPAPAALFLAGKTNREGLARIYSFEQNIDRGQVIFGQTDSVAWVALYRKLTLFQFLAAKDHVQYSVFNPIDRLETSSSQLIREELGRLQTLDNKLEFLQGLNVGFILSSKEIKSSLLALEGVFQVNGAQPFRVYRLTGTSPRVFLTDEPSNGRWTRDQVEMLGASKTDQASVQVTALEDDKVRIMSYLPNRVEVQASADKNCLLVLLDSYYPGWKATVDGAATRVLPFKEAFRAVELPAGTHSVIFSFSPDSFWYGFALSLSVALAWAASLLWRRRMLSGGSRSAVDGQRQ